MRRRTRGLIGRVLVAGCCALLAGSAGLEPRAAGAQRAAQPDSTAEKAQQQPPEPWPGTTAEGLAELAWLARGDDLDGALALGDRLLSPNGFTRWRRATEERRRWTRDAFAFTDPLLDGLGVNGPPPALRAEVQHARGLVLAARSEHARSRDALLEAAALAGPTAAARELRLASLYDAGTVALQAAESARLAIPEVRERLGLPPLAAPPAADEDAAAGPDALDVARAAYLDARQTLVTRLKADWRDADTRANLELCERRLDELDAIEREREEQEDQEDQEEQGDPSEDGESSDEGEEGEPGEPGEDGEQGEQGEEGEREASDQPSEESEDASDSDQGDGDDEGDASEQDGGDPEGDEPPQPDASDEEPQSADSIEELLTREEVQRLLDRLEAIEDQAEEVRARLRAHGRRPVEKDW